MAPSKTESRIKDVIAGITMACVGVPQMIAYSELTGLPGFRGLKTAGPAMVAFAFSTGHPWISQGVTSVSAVLTKSDLDGEKYVEDHGTEAYIQLVTFYTLLVGVASVLLALLGVGKIAQNLPKPVSVGFSWGASLSILASQMPDALFARGKSFAKEATKGLFPKLPAIMKGATGVMRLLWSVASPSLWGPYTVPMAGITLYILMKGKEYIPKALPKGSEVLIVTGVFTAVSGYLGYSEYGNVVGEIPTSENSSGGFQLPFEIRTEFPWDQAYVLAPKAVLFAIIKFSATVSICSAFEKEGMPWNANRELMAQGVSCLAAGATGSPPVGASLSRSEVQKMLGASSNLAGLTNGLVLVFMLPLAVLLTETPKAVLASIVIASVIKKVLFPKNLMALPGLDFVAGWFTALAVALCDPTVGIVGGTILALSFNALSGKKKVA
uniref:SLC26A/SulP transporter domain-containing protein n=1 Tax=Pinguiococcus pyrenoidosus TaxID=172671 RepID=A0A7R9UFT4_9STRA|mmetsp:Transcript_9115/g.34355  ORF Transcript_9115/g.34355 Transcript_9115/m.34355 type:complete len:439 (+) Transcript_9115:74-1390(+)